MKRLLFLLIFVTSNIYSQSVQSDTTAKQIEKISEDTYRLGNILIDTKNKELRFEGVVNQDSGMIELIACAPHGKTHESVFIWNIQPYHLQVGLLLVGMKSGVGASVQGDTTVPKGDSANVFISWKNGEKVEEHRAEEFAWDIPSGKPMKQTSWVFTGSQIINGVFMADQEKSLLTTYRDPFTILDNPLIGGSDDTIYKVNSKVTPKKGTTISVRIKALVP